MEKWAWQAEALATLTAAVAANADIREIWTYGSTASGDLDEWSDLDVALIADPSKADEVARPEWLVRLGVVWAYRFGAGEPELGAGEPEKEHRVRVVFDDGRRLDLAVASTPSVFQPACKVEIPAGVEETGQQLAERGPRPDVPAEVNDFRFTAAHAVVKAARNDLLIGGHLALELPRLCLVLAMRLRDRELGTARHRYGGPWNEVLERALDVVPDAAAGRSDIVDLVDASAGLFDDLAGRLWPGYVPDWSGLTALLDRARAADQPFP